MKVCVVSLSAFPRYSRVKEETYQEEEEEEEEEEEQQQQNTKTVRTRNQRVRGKRRGYAQRVREFKR
jgi:hypothetical protein